MVDDDGVNKVVCLKNTSGSRRRFESRLDDGVHFFVDDLEQVELGLDRDQKGFERLVHLLLAHRFVVDEGQVEFCQKLE